MTKVFRNRLFLQGILFGGLAGLVVGTTVAFQVGTERVESAQRRAVRWIMRRNKPAPDYSKLYV